MRIREAPPARTVVCMSTQTPSAADQNTVTLLSATRWLAGLHALGGLAVLGLAAFSFFSYGNAPDDETFAGLWIIFGVGYVVLGAVLLVLGIGAARARLAGAAYGLGLAAGLFALVVAGPGSFLLFGSFPLSPVVGLTSFALVICSVVGLVRQGARR